jgi:hypothetical protein
MRSMNPSATLPTSPADGVTGELPRINYYPPIVVTLLAAILIFLFIAGLGVLGALNTITQVGRIASNEAGSSAFGAMLCGTLSLLALLGAAYFLTAVIKGVRDLGEKVQYTRGTVVSRRGQSRKADNWLAIEPSYVGPDLEAASPVNDEQRAASVDRSQIFQPRFGPTPGSPRPDREERRTSTEKAGGYLSPDRISSRKEPQAPSPGDTEEPSAPRVVFRIDFASGAKLASDEEVMVAHSRFLQHIFYLARLKDGQWEVHRNKKLI